MRYCTLASILNDITDIGVIDVCENGIGHAYFCDEIDTIDEDILYKPIEYCFIVNRVDGYYVYVEF